MNQYCDGIRRRDFLAWGVLGASQLSLSSYLRASSANPAANGSATSGIFIFLNGGPSHQDTFDLKPEAASEYRGEFKPVSTNVPGLQICEHLPRLAKVADKFTLVRGVTHTLGAHSLGTQYLQTGTRPIASLVHPGFGSVATKEHPSPPDVPSYISVDKPPMGAGFLGVRYAPFRIGKLAGMNRGIRIRGIDLPNGLPLDEFERRNETLEQLDTAFRSLEGNHELVDGLDEFSQRAFSIISSPRMREAFDLNRESPGFKQLFGRDGFSQSCLLAIRLIEAGVRFVTLSLGGWDTHSNNFPTLKNRLLPSLDQGLAGLLNGLDHRGLLKSTAVMVTGEFGRTPKVKDNGGRDHYPRCMAMLMAGGRISGGRVVGASDETASQPLEKGFSPDDMAATFYENLGIDPKMQYEASGRPITLVRNGKTVSELFS